MIWIPAASRGKCTKNLNNNLTAVFLFGVTWDIRFGGKEDPKYMETSGSLNIEWKQYVQSWSCPCLMTLPFLRETFEKKDTLCSLKSKRRLLFQLLSKAQLRDCDY